MQVIIIKIRVSGLNQLIEIIFWPYKSIVLSLFKARFYKLLKQYVNKSKFKVVLKPKKKVRLKMDIKPITTRLNSLLWQRKNILSRVFLFFKWAS